MMPEVLDRWMRKALLRPFQGHVLFCRAGGLDVINPRPGGIHLLHKQRQRVSSKHTLSS